VILFLDFDGVLHPAEVELKEYDYRGPLTPELNAPGYTLFCWVETLERILDDEDPHGRIKIVLSTSWSYHFGLEGAKAYLPEGLQARVIGKIDHSLLSRGELILKHARKNDYERWIAIDDDRCRWPYDYQNRLVYCDSDTGISDEMVQADLRGILRDLVS
jgi:hypothetical protein